MIDLSQETEALARRLAAAQSVAVDTAVRRALEALAQTTDIAPEPRGRSPKAVATRRARMEQLADEIAALPIRDPRSPREIVDDITPAMTKLLEDALAAVRNLPPANQDDVARAMLRLSGMDDEPAVALSANERAAIAASKAAAERGEFASEEQVRATWAKHGL